jgi:hypothetical protein
MKLNVKDLFLIILDMFLIGFNHRSSCSTLPFRKPSQDADRNLLSFASTAARGAAVAAKARLDDARLVVLGALGRESGEGFHGNGA